MRSVTPAIPRKGMSELECRFLKIAGEELAKVNLGGPAALAALLDMVASWHASKLQIGFHDYGQRWLLEGNAKSKSADRLLRDLFGLGDPDPKRAA
ncbi:hypothetical protein [Phytopseudomonas dryadis]|uniref:Uncharacterized protein n=1 Tax=Phytopseudomonas dryadis TaxID=2487520 RepID=A0A4Q9QU29_9GAMM|nr:MULTISPECIES: hypothetical protein [Pseudomonas]TBU86786.1 hypothetical protein DNK44_22050 [Pseudomonas dryadis]TBV01224.1 hypothetical protein DNK34_21535 [Pseudomonas dryadis]TBV14738.1 hypothetical protein DNK41_19525 [Pseudomonas sp. FRB 230]